jgi:hypothetical protein
MKLTISATYKVGFLRHQSCHCGHRSFLFLVVVNQLAIAGNVVKFGIIGFAKSITNFSRTDAMCSSLVYAIVCALHFSTNLSFIYNKTYLLIFITLRLT